jgi:ATP-dependent DNA helicase Q1
VTPKPCCLYLQPTVASLQVREKKATGSGAIDDIAEFIADFYPGNQSGIVYCFSRRECEQVAGELRERGISAAHYHADMDPVSRSSVHRRWSTNKLQVIVGTVAFGMGINKPDVRFVIHHSLSKSLETYYQVQIYICFCKYLSTAGLTDA